MGTRLCKLFADTKQDFSILDIRGSQVFPERVSHCDIRNPEDLDRHLEGKTIFHLAAVHRDDVRPLSMYYETNVAGTRTLCNAASAKGIKKIIFTSSVAVYGFAEMGSGEDAPIRPFNDYGKSKFEAEQVLCDWANEDPERSVVIVRPTVVFGEGNRGNVYNLLRSIASGKFIMIGPGTNRKSMAYCGNVAAFLSHVEDRMKPGVRIVNYIDKPDLDMNTLVCNTRRILTGKSNVGFRLPLFAGAMAGMLADGVAKVVGRKLPISSIRVKKFVATTAFSSAAHDQFAFNAPYSLEEGLERTLKYEFVDHISDRETYETE